MDKAFMKYQCGRTYRSVVSISIETNFSAGSFPFVFQSTIQQEDVEKCLNAIELRSMYRQSICSSLSVRLALTSFMALTNSEISM